MKFLNKDLRNFMLKFNNKKSKGKKVMSRKYYALTKNPEFIVVSINYDPEERTFTGEVVKSNDDRYLVGEIRSDWTTKSFIESDYNPDEIVQSPNALPSFPDVKNIKELRMKVPDYMVKLFNLKREEYVFKGNAIQNVYKHVKKAYEDGQEVSWSTQTFLEPKIAITKLLNGDTLYDDEGCEVTFDTTGFIVTFGNPDNLQWKYVEDFDKLSETK